jgi:hypothetical protein
MSMPEVSRFFGIIIRMFFNDHVPPHFHAYYSGEEAEIGITPVALLKGRISGRALALVVEWAVDHQEELMDDWVRLHTDQPVLKIDPLK